MDSRHHVKAFYSINQKELENEINRFLADPSVLFVDIKYSASPVVAAGYSVIALSALLVYKY